jgi:hypothetical protein
MPMAPKSGLDSLPGPYSLAALPPHARATVLLSAAALVAVPLDLPAVASLASVTAVTLPLYRLVRRRFGSGTAVTPALVAFTLFWFVMLVLIELLSLVSLLGSRVAWTGLLVGLAALLQVADARACTDQPHVRALDVPPLAHALKEPWSLIVGPLALVLGILFVQSAYLTAFTGINHTDGQWYYLARSIRYLQDGTVWKYSTANDMLPHFHQTISAYALLFYGSEVPILLLSTLFGAVACIAVFELSRLAGAPVSLAVLAGLGPISVPIFSLHLGTSNFDVHTALFIVLSIYPLALAIRTGQSRYLLVAACATSLASATKLTFWFAAPGLGILWLASAVVLARRSGLRAIVRPLALATIVVLFGGVHVVRTFLVYDMSRELDTPEHGQISLSNPVDVFQLVAFNTLATTTTLLTPDILVTDRMIPVVEDTFRRVNERLGIRLPNGKLFYYDDRSWQEVFDHLHTPFLSDKAGFGAVVPLAVVPAALVIGFDALRRRAVFTLHAYVLAFAALYLLSLSISLKYAPEHVRYLIEMVLPLLILVPVVLARLPVGIAMVYLAAVSAFMLGDAYLAYRDNEQRPPDRVTTVPRQEQYATFVSPERSGYYEAGRALNRKYPVEEWPELFLFKEGWFVPVRFEYPFMDPMAQRRLTYWLGDLNRDRPAWPGPFLVLTPDVAEILRTRFAEQVALDRLSDTVWLALPRDRLRVIWDVQRQDGVAPSTVRIEAIVGAGQYRQPEYQFVTVDTRTGRQMAMLRDFSPDPTVTLSSGALSRILEVQVAVREAGQSGAAERVTIPERRMLER